MTNQKSPIITETLEIQAREALAKGKFRQAKDAFKDLYKKDKVKYLPELLQCYLGLGQEMIQNGQLSDATQIIENIRALSRDGGEVSLEIAIAMKMKDYETIARIYGRLVSQKKDVSGIQEMSTVADALVIAFQEFPALKTARPEAHGELLAVQQALEDVSGERYDDAWGKVKGIGAHSLFSRWKLFIKGMVAFYKNEDAKALEAFGRVPSDTLLHNVARSYISLMSKNKLDRPQSSEPLLQKMCNIAGYPDLASTLPRADALWQSGLHYESYFHVYKNMQPFPGEGTDIAGVLSRFYFNMAHHLSPDETVSYLNTFLKRAETASIRYSLEWMLIYKTDSLFSLNSHKGDNDKYCAECTDGWRYFLEAYTKIHGKNPKLESLVYATLGKLFSTERQEDSYLPVWKTFGKKNEVIRNETLAEEYFNQSISADSGNKAAYLGLLNVYEKTNNRSKRNKLLDKLTPLFPDDAAILFKAGVNCIEREACVKGTKYLERATRLDSLNSEIKDYLGYAYVTTAHSYFKKGQIVEGRNIFKKTLQHGASNVKSFYRGHAFIYARWAVLELKTENEAVAAEKIQLSRENAVKLFALLYFTKLTARYYALSDDEIQKLCPELEQEWANPPTPDNAVGLIKVYHYYSTFKADWLKQEKEKIIKYALDASVKPCTRDDAHTIVLFSLFDKQAEKLGKTYINKMLQIDKNDPLFIFLNYKSSVQFAHLPDQRDIDELIRILPLAEQRNDIELIREIRDVIAIAERVVKMCDFMGSDFMPNDEDEDETDEDEELL
ncbi:MAG: hypothetical protein AAB332_06770 [Planctomycetota bacterium]